MDEGKDQRMNELPFTIEQFLELFKIYNRARWPAQLIAYLLGGSALFLVIRKKTVYHIYIRAAFLDKRKGSILAFDHTRLLGSYRFFSGSSVNHL